MAQLLRIYPNFGHLHIKLFLIFLTVHSKACGSLGVNWGIVEGLIRSGRISAGVHTSMWCELKLQK